jgi:hypothetical protein
VRLPCGIDDLRPEARLRLRLHRPRPVVARKEPIINRYLALASAAFALLALPAAGHATAEPAAKPDHSFRFQVVQKLKHGLRGTPLATHAFRIESEGWRWNVNPFLVASIAGTESSFGAAACGGNAWGLGNCGFTFRDFPAGISYATRLLRENYLDLGYGTLQRMGARYAVCGSCWAQRTGWFMRSRFGSSLTLTYPRK